MTMKYKVIFADLGWYEVKARNKAEAERIALNAANNFHPEREKFEIEKTEVLPNE
ncbi:hypothetical protein [Faecalibacterium prausnitzii]|uniref:hypothetical protein n=1 Tax=Faecalibacterium prausnitzii TaxID=853 RepID=UPI001FA74D72|nr:hypothetical protein [Faecalibacterium prausnitzii]